MGFKEDLYKGVKEKADPELYQHYQDEKHILDDDLLAFFGMISVEAKNHFEGYILPQLDYMGSLEKDLIYDYTFSDLCKAWREIIFGEVEKSKIAELRVEFEEV